MGSNASLERKALQRGKEIKEELHERVSRKLEKLTDQIGQIGHILKFQVKMSSACELVQLMDDRQVTSLQILLVFIERTATIGIRNQLVLDEMFEEAIIMAKQCDRLRKEFPHKICWKAGSNLQECFPPFFGVPISLKETILYKDRITYAGHVYPVNQAPENHLLFVEHLLKMGFIPFVRSNVSPACKSADSNNNMFGYCKSGWKDNRSCGGSSGGEGGLVSCGCSPIGFGSDIGGSARIPAQWCGLSTLKPAFRYTTYGNAYFGKYSAGIPTKSEICPITRSVDDLILFFQFLCTPQNLGEINRSSRDIYLKQIPFNEQVFTRKDKLTIGYYKGIKQLFESSPAHERVVDECVEILRKKGHTLKEIQIPHLSDIYLAFGKCFLSDDTLSFLEELRKTEPFAKEYSGYYALKKIPLFVKKLVVWLLKNKEPRLTKLLAMSEPHTQVQIVEAISSDFKRRQRKIHEYLVDENIDLWISPGFPIPAIEHGSASNFTIVLAQTVCTNALHYPSGNVPVSIVRPEQLEFNDKFMDTLTKHIQQSLKDAQGLPVGVQVSSLPNNEELILRVMKQIQQQVQFNTKFICPTILQG